MSHDRRLQTLYGLKFPPFHDDVPQEALQVTAPLETFLHRCETYLPEGGFALVTGPPGVGKSAVMRLLHARLGAQRDVLVRSLTYARCRVGDFYRELSEAFGAQLAWGNRWGAFNQVRQKWQGHLEATRLRPVLLIDEAQELLPAVLSELRLLTSKDYDAHRLLLVIFAGDLRLLDRLREPDLAPLDSRIRARLRLESATVAALRDALLYRLERAGNPQLFTPSAVTALAEHAAGNLRTLFMRADDLLLAAAEREQRQVDEKLFLEVFATPPCPTAAPRRRK